MTIDTLERPSKPRQFKSRRSRQVWRCFERILIATNLSDNSMKAIAVGRKLADRFGGEISLIYVHQIPRSLEFMRGRQTMEVMENDAKRAHARFEQLCRCIRAEGAKFQAYFRIGNPHDEIVWAANASNADLLVIPAENGNRFDRSNIDAEGILRDAPCPVLLIRRNDPDLVQ